MDRIPLDTMPKTKDGIEEPEPNIVWFDAYSQYEQRIPSFEYHPNLIFLCCSFFCIIFPISRSFVRKFCISVSVVCWLIRSDDLGSKAIPRNEVPIGTLPLPSL